MWKPLRITKFRSNLSTYNSKNFWRYKDKSLLIKETSWYKGNKSKMKDKKTKKAWSNVKKEKSQIWRIGPSDVTQPGGVDKESLWIVEVKIYL